MPVEFTPAIVFLDANVLYPAGLRDLLMRRTLQGLLKARWSDLVHEEWMNAVLRDFPDITRTQLERTRDLMNLYALDSLVTDFEDRIETLTLPDVNDRHVLAAAIHCKAEIILTRNTKDFPNSALSEHSIETQRPDKFLHSLLLAYPEEVVTAMKQHRANLRNPPKTVDEYVVSLAQQGLSKTVALLQEYADEL